MIPRVSSELESQAKNISNISFQDTKIQIKPSNEMVVVCYHGGRAELLLGIHWPCHPQALDPESAPQFKEHNGDKTL